MAIRKINLSVKGMYCSGCEQIIEDAVLSLHGVIIAKASYVEETVNIEFKDNNIKQQVIEDSIEEKGYEIQISKEKNKSGFIKLLIFTALLIFGWRYCILG